MSKIVRFAEEMKLTCSACGLGFDFAVGLWNLREDLEIRNYTITNWQVLTLNVCWEYGNPARAYHSLNARFMAPRIDLVDIKLWNPRCTRKKPGLYTELHTVEDALYFTDKFFQEPLKQAAQQKLVDSLMKKFSSGGFG